MGYYADLIAIRDAYRAAERRAYKVDEIINWNRGHLRYRIEEANPGKWTLAQFTKEDVFAERSTFLVIDTRGPRQPERYRNDWALGIRVVGGASQEASELSLSYSGGAMLLPLTGPAVDRHAPLRRIAAVARGVLARDIPLIDFPAWEAAIAESNEAHAAAWDLIDAHRTIGTDAEREAIVAAHPDLARKMQYHDWDHHYADRTIQGAWETEREIKAALRLMDLDDAALLLAATRAPLTTGSYYLHEHPQAPRKAA